MEAVLHSELKKKYPVVDHAEGMYVYDTAGNRYLDCAAGIAVANIGHSVPEVLQAMEVQMKKTTFAYGGTFTSEARERLAQQIIAMAPKGMSRVFFCSGGSEAMESVIKIARQYQLERGCPSKYKIISRWQSYHGNTIATLAMGGRPSWREAFDACMPKACHIAPCNCYRCPFGLAYGSCGLQCAKELERTILYEGADTIAAFVLEPVIGTTAAAAIPPADYIQEVKRICEAYDILFCVDEVITGFGRTGKNFAVDHFGITPDIMGVAKGLGCGYMPMGAAIVHEKIVAAMEAGSGQGGHLFTFAANPLACAAASAAMTYLQEHHLVERCAKMGALFLEKLKTLETLPFVGQVRGIGMMYGVEFVADKETKAPLPNEVAISSRVAAYCFTHGLMVTAGVQGCADGRHGEAMQIAPPFIITEEEMDFVVSTLQEAILAVAEEVQK